MGIGLVKTMFHNVYENYHIKQMIQKEQYFSYFDMATHKEFFLFGLRSSNQDDECEIPENFDDFFDIQYKKFIKLHSIQFFKIMNLIIGYRVEYLDYYNQIYSFQRLQSNQLILNEDIQCQKFVLKPNENLLDVEITFSCEQLTSVNIISTFGRSQMFGRPAENTSICKLMPESSENNVIFGFSGFFLAGGIKELNVIRGVALQTKRRNKKYIKAKQYFNLKKQKQSKDPFMYLYVVNKQKKIMLGIEASDDEEEWNLKNIDDQIKFYDKSYVKNDVVSQDMLIELDYIQARENEQECDDNQCYRKIMKDHDNSNIFKQLFFLKQKDTNQRFTLNRPSKIKDDSYMNQNQSYEDVSNQDHRFLLTKKINNEI